VTVYKIINPSDPYHLTADDLVLAAIAACLLGHGKYALEATDGSEGVPLFLFGGQDEWFAAQGAGSFDAALTAATGQRAEALAEVLESVTIVGTRSSLNDIGEAAARLAVGVRRMVAQAHERTPYDAMGPVDAPNPPAVRASLADVQPGGRVRLGDVLPPLPASSALCPTTGEPLFSASKMTVYAQASVQAALSAQPSPGETLPPVMRLSSPDYLDYLDTEPSPGGQGGLNYERMFVDACAALAEVSRELGCDPEQGGAEPILAAIAELREALAARQPVGEPVAWMTHHDEPMLFPTATEAAAYCEDDEQPVPLFRSPAQAVDLGPARDVFRRWHANELNSTDAMLALVEALAVIDSKAVGNG